MQKLLNKACIPVAILAMQLAIVGAASAQDLNTQLSVETSWVGNSFGGATAASGLYQIHVCQDFDTLFVDNAGNSYTNSNYDEAGATQEVFDSNGYIVATPTDQEYAANGYAITANSKFIYYDVGNNLYASAAPKAGGSYDLAQSRSQPLLSTTIRGLAATDQTLYVSDASNNQILAYPINSDGTLGGNPISWNVNNPRRLALGSDGSLWVLQANDSSSGGGQVIHFDGSGNSLSDVITFDSSNIPVGIAVDTSHTQNSNDLVLIADNGPDQDVKEYDTSNLGGSPTGYSTFGNVGGVFSGTKGQIGALKFNGLVGVGVDGSGNIYVAENGGGDSFNSEGEHNGFGAVLEAYAANGNQLWQGGSGSGAGRYGLEFTTRGGIDPGSDGQDVYDLYHHYSLNYSNTSPGSEWTYTGFTLDSFDHPDDLRINEVNGTTWVRRIQGNRILFSTGQYAGYLHIYRADADGEIAVNSTSYAVQGYYGIYPDTNGGIWESGTPQNTIVYTPCKGLDGSGNPTYAATQTFNKPAPFNNDSGIVRRAQYDVATDTLFLSGWTSDYPDPSQIGDDGPGQFYAAYHGWLANNGTNSGPDWSFASEQDVDNYDWPQSFSVASSSDGSEAYLFLTFSGVHKIQVFNALSGSPVGTITADPSIVGPVAGAIGNVDVPYGVEAFRRSSGEYVILNEEDNQSKNLLFRWVP